MKCTANLRDYQNLDSLFKDAIKRWSNVQAITAYMPEIYGTHHTKMMIIFRHDELAQVIIHTANMIAQDWTSELLQPYSIRR